MIKKIFLLSGALWLSCAFAEAQTVGATPEYVKELTSRWKGERFADGRPKVSDQALESLKECTLEQVWGFLYNKGFHNQVEGNWIILKPGEVMTGRVVTAQFTPSRPDLDSIVKAEGKAEGRSQKGGINIWPIDILTKGDIYVADGYGKVKDGTLIGSSLGNSIYAKTGKGVIFYGSIRDMQELKETNGFNAWIKGHHPSYIKDMTPVSINKPIRIGSTTVLPGDVVFANDYGVVFVPAYLIDELVKNAELVRLRDTFERYMLQLNKYPSGEIHGDWSDKMKDEFRTWMSKHPKKLWVSQEEIEQYIKRQ